MEILKQNLHKCKFSRNDSEIMVIFADGYVDELFAAGLFADF